MKITIGCEQLLKPLLQASSVVERRQTLPILSNVLLRYGDGMLMLTGTDLEVEVVVEVQGVSGTDGVCTLTARKLIDICRTLPDSAEVTLDAPGDRATIRSGRSKFTLQTLPASDFPSLDAESWSSHIAVQEGNLRKLLERTAFAMAQQDVRYYLNGMLLETEGDTLRAVATDGHRLAKAETHLEAAETTTQHTIVPRKAVLELGRLLSDNDSIVRIELSTNHMRVTRDGVRFTSKLIDGRFPDYRGVIPARQDTHLILRKVEFQETLSRAAILTSEKFRGVRVSLEPGQMRVTATSPEQEEATDEMPIDYAGKTIEVGFNVLYLIDALRALDGDDVELRMQDANSSCVLQSPGDPRAIYLVMPMRL